MNILGINAYHASSSACLIMDGQLIAAAEEERFNRRKYWSGFPVQAIQYVLKEGGIQAYDLDHVGISKNPSANLFKKVLYALSARPSLELIRNRLSSAGAIEDLKQTLMKSLELRKDGLGAEFHHIEHHRAHLASAFFISPFPEAAILSVDGMGDFVSTMWAVGRDNHIDVLDTINFPHSLGFYYTAISQWLGFIKYGDEGKVMGLAPYGNPIYIDQMHDIVRIHQDGTFELNLDYFVIHNEGVTMSWDDGDPVLGNLYSPKLVKVFGEPRIPRTVITQHHMDVAASLQAMLEEAGLSLVRKLERESSARAICMAGGVALNSSFNGKILPNSQFKDIHIHPAAGDAGTAVGVAYYIWHQLLNKPRQYVMNHAYTGPSFGQSEIQTLLKDRGISFQGFDEDQLVAHAADLIAEGNVLGWYQGRMEWGPRALGNRSILADPRREDMKDLLNARIKHREKFRPFAPSILLEDVGDYFDQSYPDPFMIKVYNVLPEKRQVIPAVTHVDGTGRLQTVDRNHSPLYWSLINAFKERTGIGVVLNTSFNENEPIVCTPAEALDCFMRTRMDALVMDKYLIKKI